MINPNFNTKIRGKAISTSCYLDLVLNSIFRLLGRLGVGVMSSKSRTRWLAADCYRGCPHSGPPEGCLAPNSTEQFSKSEYKLSYHPSTEQVQGGEMTEISLCALLCWQASSVQRPLCIISCHQLQSFWNQVSAYDCRVCGSQTVGMGCLSFFTYCLLVYKYRIWPSSLHPQISALGGLSNRTVHRLQALRRFRKAEMKAKGRVCSCIIDPKNTM